MPLLYYWQPDNYRRDLDYGVGYHLNQSNEIMHSVDVGDFLWAFTRTKFGKYALAAKLAVRAKTINPPKFRYGRYRIWGDLKLSSFFQVEGQPNAETLIRGLSIKAEAKILAQSFQGRAAVRRINQFESDVIAEFTRRFPIEPRANILPEERLEALLLYGNAREVEKLIREEKNGVSKKRQEYLYQFAAKRKHLFAIRLQKIYDGKCQLCLWAPRKLYGENLCHGHHINWLSRGGDDAIANLVLVCPNHHAAIHQCDAVFDWGKKGFYFSEGNIQMIQLNRHL
ncbi:MAG TPA: HNH endonuclease signature motif containing protein [Allocoleopsis sp.]